MPPGSKLFDFPNKSVECFILDKKQNGVFVPNTAPRRRLRDMDIKFRNVKRKKIESAPFSIC